jgi:hypothetical protein
MFYFLAERHSATKYYQLDPGLTTEPFFQREIIDELLKNDTGCIVLWTGLEEIDEPNKSGESSGVRDLDEFIENNYTEARRFEDYTILCRNAP